MAASKFGLFDGFEAYRTPSVEDYRRVLTSGMVVPDTNVLLNLYRYHPDARDNLLDVLTGLGERVWAPHQVVAEFWTQRTNVLRDPRGTTAAQSELLKLRDQADKVIRTWVNRLSLDLVEATGLHRALAAGFDHVSERIAATHDREMARYSTDSNLDPVVKRLATILERRVGPALPPDEHREAVDEGLRRVEQQRPPGYKDGTKKGAAPAGDYVLWKQIQVEAGARHCAVLFVTGDVKEDWWRLDQGLPVGPRPELVRELLDTAGCALYMVRPDTLLRLAGEMLSVEVPAAALADVGRVQQLQQERNDRDDEPEDQETGWTAVALDAVLGRLRQEAAVQARAIERAAESDGFISREEVYRIGYGADRSLRGFTRPVRRIVAYFQGRGRIPLDAEPLLDAVYDDQSGQAIGFQLPVSVTALLGSPADPAVDED
ncbi:MULTISPECIES: PIN-like domain-containing protein [Frankia]|uniref:PIN-like domain-containing protein n=1 Tax=Frankia TaxID=1854 RepID=UPI0002D461A2|nr:MULTISPECIES: PIN-like domain-containing protein [Frankia]